MPTDASGDLYSIFYVSAARSIASEVERIVAVSRQNNRVRGITGGLLFTGGYFAQVIEGPAAAVIMTMKAITDDPRHGHVTPVWERAINVRAYRRWSMGYVMKESADRLIRPLIDSSVDHDAARASCDALFQMIESSGAPRFAVGDDQMLGLSSRRRAVAVRQRFQ